jgi:hypothetical protein
MKKEGSKFLTSAVFLSLPINQRNKKKKTSIYYNTGLWSCIFTRFICELNGITSDRFLKMKVVVDRVNINVGCDNR